jgi:membrane-associated protease RseP (regulator of RpoE activity)
MRKVNLHLFLFFLTLLTTTTAGAFQAGYNPFTTPQSLIKGLPFSLTLMLILLAHEFGHYFASRYHRITATLPYFIPAPSLIGTFGAFIKIKDPMPNKRILFDVGIAGPLSGIVVCLPILIYGLMHSQLIITPSLSSHGLVLGENLLLKILTRLIWGKLPPNVDILLHPMAFAGWIGLFVTALNLIPVGQLDGGHVSYAVLGKYLHARLSKAVIILLFILGLFTWEGWLIWGILLIFLGLDHPPPLDPSLPLDFKRKCLSTIALGVFILTFTPAPFGMR